MSRLIFYDLQTITGQADPTNLSPSRFVAIQSALARYKKRILLTIPLPPVLCRLRCVTRHGTEFVHLEGIQYTGTMSTATNGGDDQLRSSSQHSPLASQREKSSNNSKEKNSTRRAGGYFTLGYKEGFSQWVNRQNRRKHNVLIQRSGQMFQLPKPSILFSHSFPISSNLRLTHKRGRRYPPKPHQQHPSQMRAPTRPRPCKRIQIVIHTDRDNGIRLW